MKNPTINLTFRYSESDYVRAMRAHYAEHLRFWLDISAVVVAGMVGMALAVSKRQSVSWCFCRLHPTSLCRLRRHPTFGFPPRAEVPRRILAHIFSGRHPLQNSADRLQSRVGPIFASAGRCPLVRAVLRLPNVYRDSEASFSEP